MNMKDCGNDFLSSVRFRNAADLTAQTICNELKSLFSEAKIPANISEDSIKSGGFFGSTYPCVLISHPNPPQSYFDHVIIINGDTVSFKYYGFSKATFNHNKKEALKQEGKLLKSALVNDDIMSLETEFNWHRDVTSLIKHYLNI